MKKWEYNVFSENMPSAESVRRIIELKAEQNWELVSVFPNPYISSLLFPFMFVFKREQTEPPSTDSGVKVLADLIRRADESPDGTAEMTEKDLQTLNRSLSGKPVAKTCPPVAKDKSDLPWG